jgi:hypothetical protein
MHHLQTEKTQGRVAPYATLYLGRIHPYPRSTPYTLSAVHTLDRSSTMSCTPSIGSKIKEKEDYIQARIAIYPTRINIWSLDKSCHSVWDIYSWYNQNRIRTHHSQNPPLFRSCTLYSALASGVSRPDLTRSHGRVLNTCSDKRAT